jgi:hypothetical protein
LKRLRASFDGPDPRLWREGFSQVVALHDPDQVDAVTIRRVSMLWRADEAGSTG